MRTLSQTPVSAAREQLVSEFHLIPDWVDRYHFIIDQGRRLQPLRPNDSCCRIRACASLVRVCSAGDAGCLEFRGFAECPIDAGLLAIVFRIYDGHPAEVVLSEDADLVRELALNGRLSCQRLVGLSALVNHVRRHALGCLMLSRCSANDNLQGALRSLESHWG